MPVWDETDQRYRATVDDFFATEFPGGTWPFSGSTKAWAVTPTFGGGSNNAYGIDLTTFTPYMDAGWFASIFAGSPHHGTDHSHLWHWGGPNLALSPPATNARDTVISMANVMNADLGVTLHAHGDEYVGSYTAYWPLTGYNVEQHHMEFRMDALMAINDLYALSRTGNPKSYGQWPDLGGYEVSPTWREDVQAYIAENIATRGWRWFRPQQTWPEIRPLSSMVQWGASGSGAGFAYDTEVDIAYPFQRTLLHADSDLVPWVKFLEWTDYRVEEIVNEVAISGYPFLARAWLYGGYNTWDPYDVVWYARQAPTGHLWASHITALDGTVPQTPAEALEMCGVVVDSWYLGIPGLIYYSNKKAVRWTGQFGGPGFTLRGVHWPVGTTFIGLTTIEQLLSQEAVGTALVAELYPESLVGPVMSLKVPVEQLTLDLSVQGGVRLGAGAGAALAGGDGGGF